LNLWPLIEAMRGWVMTIPNVVAANPGPIDVPVLRG